MLSHTSETVAENIPVKIEVDVSPKSFKLPVGNHTLIASCDPADPSDCDPSIKYLYEWMVTYKGNRTKQERMTVYNKELTLDRFPSDFIIEGNYHFKLNVTSDHPAPNGAEGTKEGDFAVYPGTTLNYR